MALSVRGDALSQPEPGFRFFEVISNQWDPESNPNGFVNLGVAENSLMHDRLLAKIQQNLDIPSSTLTYGDSQKRIKASVARFLTRKFKANNTVEAAHVNVTNGCTTAIQNLSWVLANSGDAVLIGRPFYGGMPRNVSRRTDAQLVPVSFGDIDPTGIDALAKYEEAILAAQERQQRVAAILLVNPHNPLGRCYPRDVLQGFMKLCQRYQVHLISNEIYGLSVYKGKARAGDGDLAPFESILSIDTDNLVDPALVHVLWGMAKDFGANGLHIGFIISQQNPKLQRALLSVCEFSWSSALSDHITTSVLDDDDWVDEYIDENQRLLVARHDAVTTWATANGIEYTPSNGGSFIWVNLGDVYLRHHPGESDDLDKTVMDALLARRIFLADGVRFGSEKPGWFRIIFSHHPEYLKVGLGRILAAVAGE